MPVNSGVIRASLAIGLVAAMACGADRNPGLLAARFDLRSADGKPLTQPIHPYPTDDVWVDSASIEFVLPGIAHRVDHVRGMRAFKLEDWSSRGDWDVTLRNDSIRFVARCDPRSHCPSWEGGILRGDTIRLVATRFGGATLMYVRTPLRK